MTNEWDLLGTGQATAFVGAVEGRLYELHSVAEVLDLLGTIRESADPAIALVHDAGGTSVGPLLPSLAGVISTRGSLGAHIALLSKEFGCACIMAAKLPEQPHTGLWVRVEPNGEIWRRRGDR